MLIFPAIDLYEGRAVRLYKGDYAQMTVYSDDPVSVARDFKAQGAAQMHTVDLEGARDGGTPNLGTIERIVAETGLFVECGGGLRDMAAIERAFAAGVGRVILGTAAVSDERLLGESVQRYGAKIAVGADLRDGRIAIAGWLEETPLGAAELIGRFRKQGLQQVICTDIARDGMLCGPATSFYAALQAEFPDVEITVSGGIATLGDLTALDRAGLRSVIVGKALYEGRITLEDLGRCLPNE